jgi:Arc/MetJ family transcription regulator
MRTNIVLNEELVAEARLLSNIRTKRELIEEALKEFIASRRRLDLRDLKGCQEIHPDYDYKSTRSGKPTTGTRAPATSAATKSGKAGKSKARKSS